VSNTNSAIASDSTRSLGRMVVACGARGQRRAFRLRRAQSRAAAYRRLAVAILGLDVESLAAELRAARQAVVPTGAGAHVGLAHAA